MCRDCRSGTAFCKVDLTMHAGMHRPSAHPDHSLSRGFGHFERCAMQHGMVNVRDHFAVRGTANATAISD
jgi:hypothetical protein